MVASISPISSAASRVAYFQQDGYYASNDVEHQLVSRWVGEGAEELGLTKHVDADSFARIMDGQILDTDIALGRIRDGKREHRPGVDITFSAPKSVSIEALVFGQDDIIKCHDAAVRATLSLIEKEALMTRGYDPATKRTDRQSSPSMVAATFRHDTSRNLDPQLHTHCVIANMTKGGDGKWRSLDMGNLRPQIKFFGAYYRNELASGLLELGYDLSKDKIGHVSSFEIAGYQQETIDAFSTRRQDILAWLQDNNMSYNSRNAQKAALATREVKIDASREDLAADWQSRARSMELEKTERVVASEKEFSTSSMRDAFRAIAHLEERQPVFPKRDLLGEMLGRSAGRFQYGELTATLDKLVGDGHLHGAKLTHSREAFVSKRTLTAERLVLKFCKEGKGQARAIEPNGFENTTIPKNFTNDQKDALSHILTSEDRVVGIEGRAGTGKTTMLAALPEFDKSAEYIALAPSASAAQVLGRETGMPARTLAWFNTKYGNADAPAQELNGTRIILDEASMVSTVDMRNLMNIVKNHEIEQLVLIGDTKQLRAVQAGQPFRQLQMSGMQTAQMDERIRQRDPDLDKSVGHVLEGNISAALTKLNEGNQRVVETDHLARDAADIWLDMGERTRENTIVLAQTHAMREEINEHIRDGMREEGQLGTNEIALTRLVNAHLTRSELAEAKNYNLGDWLVFHADVPPYRIEADDHYMVAGYKEDKDGNQNILLEGKNGEERFINPDSNIRYRFSLYEAVELNVAAGDTLKWTRNDHDLGVLNGENVFVEKITKKSITLAHDNGDDKSLRLPFDAPALCHLDHGYCQTVHSAQGATADHVIAVLDSGFESGLSKMTDQSTFYVEISRARDSAVVLTDNIEELTNTLERNTGMELTGLEAIGELRAPKQEMHREIESPLMNIDLDKIRQHQPDDRNLNIDIEVNAAPDKSQELQQGTEILVEVSNKKSQKTDVELVAKNTEPSVQNQAVHDFDISLAEHEAIQAEIPDGNPFIEYGNMMGNYQEVGDDGYELESELVRGESNEPEVEIDEEERDIGDDFEIEM